VRRRKAKVKAREGGVRRWFPLVQRFNEASQKHGKRFIGGGDD
jgi:hypothetical protein